MEKLKSPFELFNIECGKGWHKLLEPIFKYIEEYNKEHDEKIEILQVKEKFGGLRFYTNFETDDLSKLIEEAEYNAENTCELCGSIEKVGKKLGWYTTCCEDCAKRIAKNSHYGIIKWRPNENTNNVKWYEINSDGEMIPK